MGPMGPMGRISKANPGKFRVWVIPINLDLPDDPKDTLG